MSDFNYSMQRNPALDSFDINIKKTGSLRMVNEDGPVFEIDGLGNTIYSQSGSCIGYGRDSSICFDNSKISLRGARGINFEEGALNVGQSGRVNFGTKGDISYSAPNKSLDITSSKNINFRVGDNKMSLTANNVNVPGTFVADEGVFGRINVNSFEKLSVKNGVQVDPTLFGPLIEAKKDTTDRLGIGHYKNGALHVYGSALNQLSSINLGFAQGSDNWDNRVIINNKGGKDNIILKGDVNIQNGRLIMGAYSFEIDPATGNLQIIRNGRVVSKL
jgi:hypothetical protein